MLCFEKITKFIASLILLALLAGCTVQPLHQTSSTKSSIMGNQAASVIIDEAKDRETQILRNKLVYFRII